LLNLMSLKRSRPSHEQRRDDASHALHRH